MKDVKNPLSIVPVRLSSIVPVRFPTAEVVNLPASFRPVVQTRRTLDFDRPARARIQYFGAPTYAHLFR
jgi:hypothetical protein